MSGHNKFLQGRSAAKEYTDEDFESSNEDEDEYRWEEPPWFEEIRQSRTEVGNDSDRLSRNELGNITAMSSNTDESLSKIPSSNIDLLSGEKMKKIVASEEEDLEMTKYQKMWVSINITILKNKRNTTH